MGVNYWQTNYTSMKAKILSEKKVIKLIDQLHDLAPVLTEKILESHRNNDSELYDAIVESAFEFYDEYYKAYMIEVQKGKLPAMEPLTRDQIAADLADDFAELVRKVEYILYAAFEDIGNFGALKSSRQKTYFVFPGFTCYGEEMMKRAFESSPDPQISFYSMIMDINEDVYLPFYQFAFMAIDLMGYDWSFIPQKSLEERMADFPDLDDLENYDPEKSLLEDFDRNRTQYLDPEVDEESKERLARIYEYLFGRGFGAVRKDTDGLKKYNVPPVIIGYFDQFGRFPEGYVGER
jgi:hypothetical protein